MSNKQINNKLNEYLDNGFALPVTPYHMPSICIPRVFPNIDEKRIRHIFDDLNIGVIRAVDFVSRQANNGDKYNLVYVHFDGWYRNENADIVRMKLLTGKEVKIIYDDPWFWKITGLKEHQLVKQEPIHVHKKEIKRATFQFDQDDYERPRPRSYEEPRPRSYEEPRPRRYEEQRPRRYEEQRPRSYEEQRPRSYEEPRPSQKRRDVSREREIPQEPIRPQEPIKHQELALAPRLDNAPIPKPAHAFIPRQIQMRNKKEFEPTSPVTPPPKRKIIKKEEIKEEKEDGEI